MFKKAERKQAKIKLALSGPSGSGKTMSALSIASGIGKKIAVIDTENYSASLYSDRFEFDILEMIPPYTTDKYIQAIQAAEKGHYEVLIIDSISHQWAGEGGVLNRKEKLDANGGNSYTNWGKLSPEQERFKSALLQCNTHLICTLRSKQDYALQVNEKGKQAPVKLGLAPIQRDGMEYEFTTMLELNMMHHAKASKDRTGLFSTNELDSFIPAIETGKKILEWYLGGKPQENLVRAKELIHPSDDEKKKQLLKFITSEMKVKNIPPESLKSYAKEMFGVETAMDLNLSQLQESVKWIEDFRVQEIWEKEVLQTPHPALLK